MRLIAVTTISSFVGSKRISSFHYDMFHGFAERSGKRYPHCDDYEFGNAGSEPLVIARTGWRVPAITCPSTNLVVSEEVKSILFEVPYVDFIPVVFSKIFDVAFCAGDFSWYDQVPPVDSETIPELFPEAPPLRATLGPYFETLCVFIKSKEAGNPEYRVTSVTLGSGRNATVEELVVPLPLLEQGGFASFGLTYMFPEQLFRKLEQYFDWNYFAWAEVNI